MGPRLPRLAQGDDLHLDRHHYLHSDLVGRVDLTRSVDLLGTFDAEVVVGPDTTLVPFTEADTIATYFPGLLPISDLFFHGTHTAATVSSNAVRAAGVASKTTLVAVKVCAYLNQCPFSSILNGVIYAADHRADVMNLSLGGAFPKRGNRALIRLITATFNYARSRGVTIVVSAGNEATDLDHNFGMYASFCDTPGVICVSATGPLTDATATDLVNPRTGPWTDIDAPAYYTNFGRRAIDVAAPGGNSSEGPPLPAPAGRDTYVWAACSQTSVLVDCSALPTLIIGAQGTSMAAPHVAGTGRTARVEPRAASRADQATHRGHRRRNQGQGSRSVLRTRSHQCGPCGWSASQEVGVTTRPGRLIDPETHRARLAAGPVVFLRVPSVVLGTAPARSILPSRAWPRCPPSRSA